MAAGARRRPCTLARRDRAGRPRGAIYGQADSHFLPLSSSYDATRHRTPEPPSGRPRAPRRRRLVPRPDRASSRRAPRGPRPARFSTLSAAVSFGSGASHQWIARRWTMSSDAWRCRRDRAPAEARDRVGLGRQHHSDKGNKFPPSGRQNQIAFLSPRRPTSPSCPRRSGVWCVPKVARPSPATGAYLRNAAQRRAAASSPFAFCAWPGTSRTRSRSFRAGADADSRRVDRAVVIHAGPPAPGSSAAS